MHERLHLHTKVKWLRLFFIDTLSYGVLVLLAFICSAFQVYAGEAASTAGGKKYGFEN